MAQTQCSVDIILTITVIFITGTKTVTKSIKREPVFILKGGYNQIVHAAIHFSNREQMWSELAFCVHIIHLS